MSLLFGSRYNGFNISCVSKPFPWLRTVVHHSYDDYGEAHSFSLILPPPLNSTEKNCDTENATTFVNSNAGNNEDCPVIFYYEEIVDNSGFLPQETYAFYCEYQNETGHGRWGKVALQVCKTRRECENKAIEIKEKYPDQFPNVPKTKNQNIH